ncbi:MAG: Hpt domain-containing protein [Pseudomonadota bacterium]
MIDWLRVNELKSDLGDDMFDEILPVFIDEISELLDQMPSKSDPVDIAGICHSIKGSAANLGFEALAQVASDGEKSANEGAVPTGIEAELRDKFQSAQAELSDQFG